MANYTLIQQNHSLNPEGYFYLYELDFTTCINPVDQVLYLSPYRNGGQNIVFGGQEYTFQSMALSEFTVEAGGKIMSPVLTILANGPTDPLMKLTASTKPDADGRLPDVRGMKLRRLRSMARYLDGEVDADPTQFEEITLDCDGLDGRNKLEIKFRFSPARGIEGINDRANRTLSPGSCNLKYRVWDTVAGEFKYTPEADGGCPWGQDAHRTEYPTVADYTPGTGPTILDQHFNQVSMLVKFDGDASTIAVNYADQSPSPKNVRNMQGTNGSAKVTSVVKKYGTKALTMGLTEGGLNVATKTAVYPSATHADFNVGTGDFTMEGWFKDVSFDYTPSPQATIFSFAGIHVQSRTSGVQFFTDAAPTPQTSTNKNNAEWRHWALVRQSGMIYVYCDGVKLTAGISFPDSITGALPYWGNSSTPDNNHGFTGWVDELRFTRVARYTGDSFVSPAAFPTAYSQGTGTPPSGWGSSYDANDEVTTDPTKDRCNRFLPACLKRFGTTGNFPFSGKIVPTGDQC